MPKLEVEGYGTFDVPEGQRLVRAIEMNGVDILHRCGGHARCTTCRVAFSAGEPAVMTVAERDRLTDKELLGEARLSCQILCDHDMKLRPLMTLHESGLPDPGPTPHDEITPEPSWVSTPDGVGNSDA
jgi:ferredoxin